MSSTNFRSILIFASCVVGTRNIVLYWVIFYLLQVCWRIEIHLAQVLAELDLLVIAQITRGQPVRPRIICIKLRHFAQAREEEAVNYTHQGQG